MPAIKPRGLDQEVPPIFRMDYLSGSDLEMKSRALFPRLFHPDFWFRVVVRIPRDLNASQDFSFILKQSTFLKILAVFWIQLS